MLGADVALISWTVVETGMYLAAACLIGLRPVLSVSKTWISQHASRFSSKPLISDNSGGFSGARYMRKGSSASNVTKSKDAIPLGSFDQTRNIRVDHEFSVTSTEGDAVSYNGAARGETFLAKSHV